jgi:hypothetical protein
MVRPPGKNGRKPPYRGWLSSTSLGDSGVWVDRDKDGETKNTLSFRGTGLKA